MGILGGILGLAGCSGGGGGDAEAVVTADASANREYRALVGVSMGAYGAINLGTKLSDRFGVIGALGGPLDQRELIRHLVRDSLEVKPQTSIPQIPGDDFTFDHLPPYPDRGTRVSMFGDLVLAFGNPFLHHADPAQQFLASSSEPAILGVDDVLGSFVPPFSELGFSDGGDVNRDGLRQINEFPDLSTQVLLLALGTLGDIAGVPAQSVLGERALADLDGDGIYDVGDGIVVNLSEPFDDLNGNLVYEPQLGEIALDVGLDGVPGSGDHGEGNGLFDYDPDRGNWLTEDPISRLRNRTTAQIESQRIYMDVGSLDEFGFEQHYLSLVALLESKGIGVEVQDGFDRDCLVVPETKAPFFLLRYEGGHIGFAGADDIVKDLLEGDVCGPGLIWQRLLQVVGFLNTSFPDGFYGTGGLQILGDVVIVDAPSPTLALPGAAIPTRRVMVYRPPAFQNTNLALPVVHFLVGHGQEPDDYVQVAELLDILVLSGQIQNICVAFLPGSGGLEGSFYVNHRVPEEHAGVPHPTSGRYQDSTVDDLIPYVENVILQGRIKR